MSNPAVEATRRTIRAELARAERTQAELAEQLGHSTAWVSRRVKGDYSFTLDEIHQIADWLGVPFAVLVQADARSA